MGKWVKKNSVREREWIKKERISIFFQPGKKKKLLC